MSKLLFVQVAWGKQITGATFSVASSKLSLPGIMLVATYVATIRYLRLTHRDCC